MENLGGQRNLTVSVKFSLRILACHHDFATTKLCDSTGPTFSFLSGLLVSRILSPLFCFDNCSSNHLHLGSFLPPEA